MMSRRTRSRPKLVWVTETMTSATSRPMASSDRALARATTRRRVTSEGLLDREGRRQAAEEAGATHGLEVERAGTALLRHRLAVRAERHRKRVSRRDTEERLADLTRLDGIRVVGGALYLGVRVVPHVDP